MKEQNDMAKALEIYDLLRQAHHSIKEIWHQHADIIGHRSGGGRLSEWEMYVDLVDTSLYVAEDFFVRKNMEESK